VADLVADDGELVWVSRTVHGHAIVVQVCGEVDLVSRAVVDEQLEIAEALVVPPAPVVLDLTSTVFFGSAGLSLVVGHAARCAELGSRLRVVADHRPVLRPISIVGLDTFVDVVPTVFEALERRSDAATG
jgi:anti-anti-sigma factor